MEFCHFRLALPQAFNDLRPGGKFTARMESKDGSIGFDFGGTYTLVEEFRKIEYIMDDDRRVQVSFLDEMGKTNVIEIFEAESENSIELQRDGWQAILNSFKNYVESKHTIKE